MNERTNPGALELIRSGSAEADRLTGYKKSARAEKIQDGLLPDPISIGGRARAFLGYELEMVSVAWAVGLDEERLRQVVKHLKESRGFTPAEEICSATRELIADLRRD